MSIANKLSRGAVANGGFGDPDVTPNPLRISKTRTSTAAAIHPPHSIHISQNQGNLPIKKRSTRINTPQPDLSLQHLTAPTSEWARRNTFLYVHKQRQSEPINTNVSAFTTTSTEPDEPIGLSPAASPARSRNSYPTMSQLGSSSDPGTRPVSIRAFTTGTYSRHNLLSPVHEVSPARRVVTNAEAFYKGLDGFISLPHRITHKQSSNKSGLISRVMSGLTNRNHVSHSASRGGDDVTQSLLHSSPATPSPAYENSHTYKQSTSSSETDAYCASKFHHARAAYPTPPTSCDMSSTTVESLDPRHSAMPQRFRELCKPADAALLGVELALTPEYDEMSFEKDRGMWVSLDIKGTAASSVQDVWWQHTGLDIVVIIDNS